jgi:uncharacterized membrane protein YidH (DUF202 family)
MAVSSFVLGVVALCIAWIPLLGYFAFPLGFIGFVLGLAGVRKAKRSGQGRAMPRIGWMLNVAAIGLAVLAAVTFTNVADCIDGDQSACERIDEDDSNIFND